jgi:hypothetical protein
MFEHVLHIPATRTCIIIVCERMKMFGMMGVGVMALDAGAFAFCFGEHALLRRDCTRRAHRNKSHKRTSHCIAPVADRLLCRELGRTAGTALPLVLSKRSSHENEMARGSSARHCLKRSG